MTKSKKYLAKQKKERATKDILSLILTIEKEGNLDPDVFGAFRTASRKLNSRTSSSRAYSPGNLLTPEEVGLFLSLSPKTLANMRSNGSGPPFIKLSSRAIRYQPSDLVEYVEQRKQYSTRENGQNDPLKSRAKKKRKVKGKKGKKHR